MLRDELRPGMVTEIRRVDTSGMTDAQANEIYNSKIIAVNDDDTIDLTIPVFMDKEISLERNIRYSFLFTRDNTMQAGQGVFLQRIRIDNVPMARVKMVTAIRKIQRRDYYRLGCNIETMLQVVRLRPDDVDDPRLFLRLEKEFLDDEDWKMGTILDISGGGLKFISEAAIMDFPYLCFNFFLDMDKERKLVTVVGKLLGRQPIPRSLSCTYRVKFTPEHTKAQDDILAYIYSRQRMIARKEQGI